MTSMVNPFGSCFICSNAFAAASQSPCAEHTAKSLLYIVATSAFDNSSLAAPKTKFVNVNACVTGELLNLFDRSHDTKKSTVPCFLILVSFKHGTFASLSLCSKSIASPNRSHRTKSLYNRIKCPESYFFGPKQSAKFGYFSNNSSRGTLSATPAIKGANFFLLTLLTFDDVGVNGL